MSRITSFLAYIRLAPGERISVPDVKRERKTDVRQVHGKGERYDETHFHTHSFTTGEAPTLASLGVPEHAIQCVGRWKLSYPVINKRIYPVINKRIYPVIDKRTTLLSTRCAKYSHSR